MDNFKAREDEFCVLLLEDDEFLRHSLTQALETEHFKVLAFESAQHALGAIPQENPDVVLTDFYLGEMNDMDGQQVLSAIREIDSDLPVVLMTARGCIANAVEAIRTGAFDFIEKPFNRECVVRVLRCAAEKYRLFIGNRTPSESLDSVARLEKTLRGNNPAMALLRRMILRIAATPANVIILGETGAGKEMVARCLHEFSGRSGHFVAINCAAIPDELFESELFGHEPGAFTGAMKSRMGKVEYSDGGTLFLDEIEAMPLHMQAKILRVLQERQVERLGGNKVTQVDLRVVAATKVDLKDYSAQGKFRLDLFYRLNVANLVIPPVRDRREDIPLLFAQFLEEAALRFGQKVATIPKELQKRLLTYDWPGNVRELRNAAEQLQLSIPLSLDRDESAVASTVTSSSLDEILASIEQAVIADMLRRHDGVASAACAELKINYSTLYRKMKHYNMDLLSFRTLGEAH